MDESYKCVSLYSLQSTSARCQDIGPSFPTKVMRWETLLLPRWEICLNVGSISTSLVTILLKRHVAHLEVVRQDSHFAAL